MPQTLLDGLGLNYEWDAGADGWKAGMDKNLVLINRLALATVIDILDDPPVSPAQNDAYIVGTGTGAWLGQDDQIAVWDDNGSVWRFTNGPVQGWVVHVTAKNIDYRYDGTGWMFLNLYADKLITVGATGFDYAKVSEALDAIKNIVFRNGAKLEIQIQDEVITETAGIEINHPNQDDISITGKTFYSTTASSVVSSSGVAGNYSITLQLLDGSNAFVGNMALISNPAGGTNREQLAGAWKITAKPTTNQITITNTSFGLVPSGAVTATVVIVPSGVVFTDTAAAGFLVKNSKKLGLIEDLFLEGSSNSVTGVHSGVETNNSGSVIELGIHVGIHNFMRGIMANTGGSVLADNCHVSNSFNGLQCANNSTIRANTGISNGNKNSGGEATKNGFLQLTGIVCGNQFFGLSSTRRSLSAPQATATIIGNGTGLFASKGGWMDAVGTTVSGNTTDYSPLPNTVGNEEAYIDT